MVGNNAISGVLHRIEDQPNNDLPARQEAEMSENWNGQWGNWDDLGGGDPGWGDIKG